MRHWYVVRSQPHAERRARDNLLRQGFEAWLPLCRRRRRHARKMEIVLRPLFPRYLFVAIDLDAKPWRAMLSTFGVASVIQGPMGPVPIPEAVIAGLRARADLESVIDLEPEVYETGTKVRITSGAFTDVEGIFQARTDTERVAILLTLMGHAVRVMVPEGDIEPV
ncbi:MAG: transcriptional activator RfaH [Alphaproteobacteria bacterium]|nr:transcriptional activator RfaH [Alphaproteobacteria bacterium]